MRSSPNVRASIEAGVPCVVGTSGWDAGDVDEAAKAAGVPVFYAPNFAIGAVLMMRFAAEASVTSTSAEIVELHHATKLDAPSGTAKATAEAMGGDVPIHSVRLPGLVAHQEVLLGGAGETLTIRHDTTSREAFVPGVLLALERLRALPPGRDGRARRTALSALREETIEIGECRALAAAAGRAGGADRRGGLRGRRVPAVLGRAVAGGARARRRAAGAARRPARASSSAAGSACRRSSPRRAARA